MQRSTREATSLSAIQNLYPLWNVTFSTYVFYSRIRHWVLSWSRWVQYPFPYRGSFRSILILLLHRNLFFSSWPFPSDFATGHLKVFSISLHTWYYFLPYHPPLSDEPYNIWRRLHFMKPHMQFSASLSSFLSLTSRSSPWLQRNTENSVFGCLWG